MTDIPGELLTAINDQAEARVRMDIGGYARYLTPAAIDSLRASFPGIPPRVSRYQIDSSEQRGADHVICLRYFVRDESFVVRSRWRQDRDGWQVVHAERLWEEGERRPGLFSRLVASVFARVRRRRS